MFLFKVNQNPADKKKREKKNPDRPTQPFNFEPKRATQQVVVGLPYSPPRDA